MGHVTNNPVEERYHFELVRSDGWFKFDPNQPTVNTIGKYNGASQFQFTQDFDPTVYSPRTTPPFPPVVTQSYLSYVYVNPPMMRPLFYSEWSSTTPPADSAHCVLTRKTLKFTPFPPIEIGWVAPSFTIEYAPVDQMPVVPRQKEIYKVCEICEVTCPQRKTLVWKQPTADVTESAYVEHKKQCGFCKAQFANCPFCTNGPVPLSWINHNACESRWVIPTFTPIPKQLLKIKRVKNHALGENGFSRKPISRVRKYWCPHCFEYVFHYRPKPLRGKPWPWEWRKNDVRSLALKSPEPAVAGGSVLSDDISCAMVVDGVGKTNGLFQRSGHKCLKDLLHDHFVRPSQMVEQHEVASTPRIDQSQSA